MNDDARQPIDDSQLESYINDFVLYSITGEDAQLVADEEFDIELTREQIEKLDSIVYKYIDHGEVLRLAIEELLDHE